MLRCQLLRRHLLRQLPHVLQLTSPSAHNEPGPPPTFGGRAGLLIERNSSPPRRGKLAAPDADADAAPLYKEPTPSTRRQGAHRESAIRRIQRSTGPDAGATILRTGIQNAHGACTVGFAVGCGVALQ